MKCRNKGCGREIDDDSIYCKWCGEKQIRTRKKKDEISVPKPRQLKSGAWNIELRAEGVSITEPTPELCQAKARAIRAGFIQQKKAAPGITFSQAIDKFIADQYNTLSPSTIRGYRSIQKNRLPRVMNAPMGAAINWQAEFDKMVGDYAPKTIRNTWGLITAILRYFHQPIPSIKISRKKSASRPFLEPSEILVFLDAIKGDSCEVAFLLGLHSLRLSEIQALCKDTHIDLAKKLIHVSGATVPDEHHQLVTKSENKTEESERTVPIMIPRLYELLAALPDGSDPVVSASRSTIYKHIKKIAADNGLPPISEHCLRHSFVSLGYHLRLSETEVMEMGGWSDSHTVHKIYLHLAKKDRMKAETKMAKFYRTAEKMSATKPANTNEITNDSK